MTRLPGYGLALGLALAACNSDRVAGGAGAGNPPQAQVSVALKAEVVAAALVKSAVSGRDGDDPRVTDSLGSAVTLTGIHCRLQSVEFHFPDSVECSDVRDLACDGDKVVLNQARDVDWLTGVVTPPIDTLRLPAGVYPKLRLEFGSSSEGHSQDAPPVENVVIRGTVAAAGQIDKPFEFSLALKEGMDFEPAGGLAIKAGVNNTLQLLWAVNHWFNQVDMLHCFAEAGAPDSDGVTRFHGDEACDEAGKRIRRNIEVSGKAENHESSDSH